MSEHKHPAVMCDGADESLGCPDMAVELDSTLGGLAHIVGSDTQLPPGWTGPRPGSRDVDDRHLCPDCTRATSPSPVADTTQEQ